MKRLVLMVILVSTAAFLVGAQAAAPTKDDLTRIAALERRVAELEGQVKGLESALVRLSQVADDRLTRLEDRDVFRDALSKLNPTAQR